MPILAEQQMDQRELKNARALFSQYNQLSPTASLQREQDSVLKGSLGDSVPALASIACYSSSHTAPAWSSQRANG